MDCCNELKHNAYNVLTQIVKSIEACTLARTVDNNSDGHHCAQNEIQVRLEVRKNKHDIIISDLGNYIVTCVYSIGEGRTRSNMHRTASKIEKVNNAKIVGTRELNILLLHNNPNGTWVLYCNVGSSLYFAYDCAPAPTLSSLTKDSLLA